MVILLKGWILPVCGARFSGGGSAINRVTPSSLVAYNCCFLLSNKFSYLYSVFDLVCMFCCCLHLLFFCICMYLVITNLQISPELPVQQKESGRLYIWVVVWLVLRQDLPDKK